MNSSKWTQWRNVASIIYHPAALLGWLTGFWALWADDLGMPDRLHTLGVVILAGATGLVGAAPDGTG